MSCAVICTLGPSCRDVETLVELLEAGMTAARVDLTVSLPHSPASSGAWHDLLPLLCLCHVRVPASTWHGLSSLLRLCHVFLPFFTRMDALYTDVRSSGIA